jgi:excisionase family DNA binding protein
MTVYMSVKNCAASIGVSEWLCRELVQTGELAAIRVGKRRLVISDEALNQYLESHVLRKSGEE